LLAKLGSIGDMTHVSTKLLGTWLVKLSIWCTKWRCCLPHLDFSPSLILPPQVWWNTSKGEQQCVHVKTRVKGLHGTQKA